MFNKDNVFITVNEEVSSIIQQYIIREIKKVLDKYKSIVTEEISSVEKLINSISNEELMEEFLNDWSMSLKIAKSLPIKSIIGRCCMPDMSTLRICFVFIGLVLCRQI